MSTRTIGVFPAAAAHERRRLFAALGDGFEVSFEPRDPGDERGLDAAVLVGVEPGGPAAIPTLAFAAPGGAATAGDATVTFSSAADRRLAGRTLTERDAAVVPLAARDGAEVLAHVNAGPVWLRAQDGSRHAALAPGELDEREPLKEALRAGRFLGLLPLVELLRELTADRAWTPPPLRALLMFDDPNLRWRSYGHIDYRRLAEHAREHDYHAAMAMIPLDGALFSKSAAALFAGESRLSLLMHGLVHEHRELMRPLPEHARTAELARALRQVESFERRSGVQVSRVMCAPHGEASEDFLASMLGVGLEAVFADLPFPWLAGEPPRGPGLTYWHGVNFVAGGLPVIPRYPFTYDPEEVVLRAYLDQPLILYGHHEDVQGGLDPLASAAELVNALGPAEWTSAARIARGNFMTRRAGDETLELLLLSRRADVDVPSGVRRLRVVLPVVNGPERDCEVVAATASAPLRVGGGHTAAAELDVAVDGPGALTVELRPRDRVDHHAVGPARVRPWPVVRRALTEGRDRLRPLVR